VAYISYSLMVGCSVPGDQEVVGAICQPPETSLQGLCTALLPTTIVS
jgi:hypothetical protein